jgi:hypothetical protein
MSNRDGGDQRLSITDVKMEDGCYRELGPVSLANAAGQVEVLI